MRAMLELSITVTNALQKVDSIRAKGFLVIIAIIYTYREVVIFKIFPLEFATTRTCLGMVFPAGFKPIPLYTSKKVSCADTDFAPGLFFTLGFLPATSGNWRETLFEIDLIIFWSITMRYPS